MLKMMLAGVTLVESRGCVNLWSMEYSSVCVVSSRHQIGSPDEKRIEYMIQGHDHWSYPTITSLNYPARASSRLIFVGVSQLPRILGSMMPTLIRMMNSYDCPPWKLGTLYNDGCPHHLGKTNHTPLYIIRSISWRGGNHSKQSWADQLVWTRLGFSRQNHHVCKYSVLSRRIMQDFVITLIIRVMDFTIFHHWHLSIFHLPIYN